MGDLLELTARAEPVHFWFRGFRAHVRPAIHELAAGRRDLRILDCGCGTGYNLTRLLQPYGTGYGFDLTRDAMARARLTGRPVVRADMEHIPFRSCAFDLATAFDVVQSVPDDRKALGEMGRVVRRGGHVVLNVTALDLLRGDHSDVWGERRRYTPGRMARLLEDAGLKPVRISFLFTTLLPLMLAVRTGQKVARFWRRPRGDADLRVPPAPVNEALARLVELEARIGRRVRLPFGSSLLVVGRKP